jgi:AcrR family transcriptional regulator
MAIPRKRTPLSRERVLRTALKLADRGGIDSLSMRKLGQELGVEAMSLYNHVADKDDLFDGLIDLVFAEIAIAPTDAGWMTAMRERAVSAREVLKRHPWALGVMESRARPGPANLRHHDAVLAALRKAGFSVQMAAHAYSLLDAYIYGFTLNELSLPLDTQESVAGVAEQILEENPAGAYPYLAEMAADIIMKPGYDYGDEFEYGLDVILDGLQRARRRKAGG